MSALIIHMPKQFLPPPPDYRAAMLECCDLIARKRFGVQSSLMLPTEQRELIVGYLSELWDELDMLPTKGRAS
jgi:hypothetical protein